MSTYYHQQPTPQPQPTVLPPEPPKASGRARAALAAFGVFAVVAVSALVGGAVTTATTDPVEVAVPGPTVTQTTPGPTVTRTTTVEVVPQACLDAVDLANEVMQISGDAFGAIADEDLAGMAAARRELESTLPRYTDAAAACTIAGRGI